MSRRNCSVFFFLFFPFFSPFFFFSFSFFLSLREREALWHVYRWMDGGNWGAVRLIESDGEILCRLYKLYRQGLVLSSPESPHPRV